MRGGVTWSKRRGNLPDEVPRRSPGERRRINMTLRPLPKGEGRRRQSAGHALALAPWGLQRVRRRSLGEQKDTPTRAGGRVAWHGSSAPTGSDRDGSPWLGGGEGPCGCAEQTLGDAAPDLRLVDAQRITWTMGVHGTGRRPTPRTGHYRWGRPVRDIRTLVHMGNGPHGDTGEGLALTCPLPTGLRTSKPGKRPEEAIPVAHWRRLCI